MFKKFIRSKITIGIITLLFLGVGGYSLFHHTTKYQFIQVVSGPITESVSLTGNTTPSQSVSLAFGSSGIISHVYSALGKEVSAGQVLADLDTSDLTAQLHQAQANVDTEQAKLAGLEAGATPDDIAVSQTALDKANQDLANMYSSIVDTSTDAYAKGNDAVNTQMSQMFINNTGSTANLSYATSNSQAQTNAQLAEVYSITALNKWSLELTNTDTSNAGLEKLLTDEISYLATVRQLLNNVSTTLQSSPSLSAATLATYKMDVSTALSEVNIATTNLNTISQSISSQKLTVSQLQAALDFKKAGSTTTDIAAEQAQVEQAQASVQSAEAKLENAQIIAPISGTVTQFDAKIGQFASTVTPLVSIMSDSGYEVDGGVSEIDIGKVNLGDTVSMTLDAFPGETFSGSVFYIAPAETDTGGVISYLIKISFDKSDSRIKSGLTANIDIQTKYKPSVLILPQYAILQNDQGTFVETLVNNKIVQNPVTLGIQDETGNVEVLSGVTEGEQVLNIGLKS
ncbi:MAG: efflux RND transporter periplasmic adaptor subunit [Candidatus Pacebacteria bacterium]|nr:efflux RND transporter periplasmic adaptor subunit [Candidatus Paceibacterota bacterium]